MTSITPLIGNENAQYSFLRRFGDLCADPLFHVRKVRALNLFFTHYNAMGRILFCCIGEYFQN